MTNGAEPLLINVNADGTLGFVYDDDLEPLLGLGEHEVRRASHVEMAADGWMADLSPVSGPVLGPFPLRADALRAELDWLRAHGY